jgi:hypothetical protein
VKVPFCKTVDVQSEVTIDIDDITSALNDALGVTVDGTTTAYDHKARRRVFPVLNAVHQCLTAITDEMIADTKPAARLTIASALRKLATRYSATGEDPKSEISDLKSEIEDGSDNWVCPTCKRRTESANSDCDDCVNARSRELIVKGSCPRCQQPMQRTGDYHCEPCGVTIGFRAGGAA